MQEKILVVDDEESIRYTFRGFLEDAGYQVETAETYADALQQIEAVDFDLVFIDIILDGPNGIDLLKKIKPRTTGCQAIIITGAPTIDTASEALRFGALDYLVKPVREETLLRVTGMVLRHKALAEEKENYQLNLEATLRSVRDGIISVDKDFKVVQYNAAAVRICGLDGGSARGKPLPSLVSGCGGSCLQAMQQTLGSNQPVEEHNIECQSRLHPGQIVSISAAPLQTHNERFAGGVMVVRDETRLVNLERRLREQSEFDTIVGKSKPIQECIALVKSLADVQTTVLLSGESGTGKELVVDALHNLGERRDQPLVKVNCSALSETLLESELFGHVKGAFTDATRDKLGRFQKADGGTLFLDEIGDITPKMQLRFLRAIERMEFERVGDSTPVRVDVRVVAATNQDLRAKVATGDFREDLYYRLKVFEIRLPPLRERRGDIPLLINHFLAKFNKKLGKQIKGVSADVEKIFMTYPWPGNVRELENTLEHAFILCGRSIISVGDLPREVGSVRSITTLSKMVGDDGGGYILAALKETGGNKTRAAKLLGVSRRTLYRKMQSLGLPL